MDGISQKDYSGEFIGQGVPGLNRKEDGKSLQREGKMYVRLRTEWNSYWKDSILDIPDEEARDLIRQRIAIPAKKDDCMRTIGRVPRDKSLWEPDRDKMVKVSKNKERNDRSERRKRRIDRGDDL